MNSIEHYKKNEQLVPNPVSVLKRKLRLIEAIEILVTAEGANRYSPTVENELFAIVSHWLQNRTAHPILFGSETAARWEAILIRHALLKGSSKLSMPDPRRELSISLDYSEIAFPPLPKPKFKFIDLFAGLGGFRIALQRQGGKCVFSSEWDTHAKKTYFANFGEVPFGDIRQFTSDELDNDHISASIPDHDVLCAGFPCQPFSRAGVSARSSLGQKHGFSCEIQGSLFFDVMRIAQAKRPKVLFLENVKNLQVHDGGRTFERIQQTIEEDLGYSFNFAVIDSSSVVPQRRKRCYIVCFRDKSQFTFPKLAGSPLPLKSILDETVPESYTLSDRMWQGHIKRTSRNVNRGAGFTAYEADLEKPANTLVARYYKDGKECLIPQAQKNPRMLTPRECARLQGYPEDYILHSSDMQAYRQFGNSVTLPIIETIAKHIIKTSGLRK